MSWPGMLLCVLCLYEHAICLLAIYSLGQVRDPVNAAHPFAVMYIQYMYMYMYTDGMLKLAAWHVCYIACLLRAGCCVTYHQA